MRDIFLFVIIVFLLLIGTEIENINDNLIKQNDLIKQQNNLLDNSKTHNTLDTLHYINQDQ